MKRVEDDIPSSVTLSSGSPHPEESAMPITVPMETAAIGLHHKAHPAPAFELTR